jgi:hypothetical protein
VTLDHESKLPFKGFEGKVRFVRIDICTDLIPQRVVSSNQFDNRLENIFVRRSIVLGVPFEDLGQVEGPGRSAGLDMRRRRRKRREIERSRQRDRPVNS